MMTCIRVRRFKIPALKVFLLLALLFPGIAAEAAGPCSARLPKGHFTATVNGLAIDLPLFSFFVMPGEVLGIEPSRPVSVTADRGDVITESTTVHRWKAPGQPGIATLQLRDGHESLRLNVFIMRPASEVKRDRLDGYRIGSYPAKPFRGLDVYLPPAGFIEVTPETADTRLTPLFTLRQFLSKQQGGWPKFVVLREEMLLKLHRVAELVDRAGHDSCGIVIMSGFRTPFYNAAIGNGKYSRHVYGGAADIYIDANPKDGVMDDLNRDGRIDKKDAAFLYDLIDGESRRRDWTLPFGGLGEYGANSAHGPFVHIDARGYKARWGR